nr:endonuclease/exonuclease/phosphatase family protein [Actinomycetales bacterium]
MHRPWVRVLAWVVAAIPLAGAAALAAAPVLGLQHANPVGQLLAARGLIALISAAAALLFGIWFVAAGFRRRRALRSINPRSRAKNKPIPPRFPTISLTLALAAAASAGLHLGVLAYRGLDRDALATLEDLAGQPENTGETTIVALNTQWANVPPDVVASLVTAAQADVVFLPETPIIDAIHVRDLLGVAGREFQVFPERKGDSRDTSLLVANDFGEYRSGGHPVIGASRAEPVGASGGAATGPTLTAVHAYPPPTPWPLSWLYGEPREAADASRDRWVTEVRDSLATCTGQPWGIIGGDFNATRDHISGMPDCGYVDVLVQTGAGGWGTWPDEVHPLLGAPIDRILVDPAHWSPVDSWLVELPGTDHRAVVARVAAQ